MVYMLCFKSIPMSPDPTTGMYVVRKDMNINSNRQCGAIIAASKLVQLCPLAPAINGVADRMVTKTTVLAHYSSFHINKYHNIADFKYIHVM
jgi:hypothetical protein